MTKPSPARVQVVARSHYGIRPEAYKRWADLAPNMRASGAQDANNEIEIYGLILPHEEVTFMRDCFGDETAISGKMFREAMDAIEGDVVLRINSDGGDVFEASTMLAAIRERQQEGFTVTAKVDGIAASAASLLASACDMTIMSEMGFIMIHEAAGGMYGSSDDLATGAKLLADMNEMAAVLYAKRTGMEEDDIRIMMADETYMSAAEAVEKKFAAEIQSAPKNDDNMDAKKKAAMKRRNARLAAVYESITMLAGDE